MESNPYKTMLDTFSERVRGERPRSILTGVVSAVSPLEVLAGGVRLSAQSGLMVSADLLPRTRRVQLSEPDSVIRATVFGASNGTLNIDAKGMETLFLQTEQAGMLAVGDRVLLATSDENIFVVICKVVSA